MLRSILLICLLSEAFNFNGIYAQIVFNEVMPSNISTLYDEDGDTPDWIELYNAGATTFELGSYYLSDDANDMEKWQLPNVIIEPNQHLLLFASGKDNRSQSNHWETIINWGDYWKYKLGFVEPPSGWKEISFNDLGWSIGKTGIGYGDNDDSTIVSPVYSLYMRKTFQVDDLSFIESAVLHADYDDGFIAYLNGIEIARANMDNAGTNPPFNQLPDNAVEAKIYQGGLPQTFYIDSLNGILQEGVNVLSIQVHNYGITSSDLTMIPFFTFGMSEAPINASGINPILTGLFPNIHTNFKLSSGETIYLSDSLGYMIDTLQIGNVPADISYGRYPNGSAALYYFEQPTPGEDNLPGYQSITEQVQVLPEGNFFNSSVSVTLQSEVGVSIYYTLDGSEPDQNSQIFTSPININSTSVIRAKAYQTNALPSFVSTKTYFINESSTLPIFSISTDPYNFWDQDSGIYVLGSNAEPGYPYFGANFWEDWEKPLHVEFFEPSRTDGFSIDCGAKIFGGWSRGNPQKSLAFYMRGDYGFKTLDYKLFENREINSFKNVVLRNSGNDWNHSMLRDGMMQSIVCDLDVETQAYRPAILFINGEYWGIQNIREKVNEDFISSYHNVNPGNIDLLENDANVIEGTNENYIDLLIYIQNSDLSNSLNFNFVENSIDIDNFIDYQLFNIYVDNQDWPGNNLKYWREREANSKWRWLIFDTDFGFNLYNPWGHDFNTLEFALATNGPDWPNPPWSTLMLRKLMTNQQFKYDFINRFADLSNSIFMSDSIITKIDSIAALIEPEIPRHIDRWNSFDYNSWLTDINSMRTFAEKRIINLRAYFIQYFQLLGTAYINCNVSDNSHGYIRINRLYVSDYPWTGHYFQNIPVEIKAISYPGYKFKEWQGDISSSSSTVTLTPQTSNIFTAVFEPDTLNSTIVINEINYNSLAEWDTEDWIEFFNNSSENIDLSNWEFKDSNDDNIFEFPEGLTLNSQDYLILSKDTSDFKSFFPAVANVVGGFDFSLSNGGELIRLYNSEGIIVDSLTYDDQEPWPSGADGTGRTLALKEPAMDNSLPENWIASEPYGTPGENNDSGTDVNDKFNVPIKFELFQNYPNPFNPITKIEYSISQLSRVQLSVFNVLGEKISELVNEKQKPGTYQVNFDAESFSSGVYFYVLKADENIQSLKMILLK